MIEVNCNLCGRDKWQIRFPATANSANGLNVDVFRCTSPDYGSHAQIVQCDHCGLVYSNPRWSDEELVTAYTGVEDETYVEEREGREITFHKHLAAMERFTGPANGRSLLDVGAYIGVFVEIACRAGWDAYGIEPSSWAVSNAKSRNLNVFQGTLDSPELQDYRFDVITLWDVIEHVADPRAELHKAHKLLKSGGWLILHTMDIDSLAARLLGGRWPWLMDMHLFYFSQKTLAKMLRTCGYEIVWIGTQGRYLRLGYLASRLAGLSRPLGRAATWLFNLLRINEVAVPINLGDLFTIYARRPSV
ncbi:MAG: class I SAM-dependent methyltransferase [Candidatus Promineifilaceae bacterium]|nr:class I SAM-dependent methyltransferase [Candidatus Promineifilaceae bacterium]